MDAAERAELRRRTWAGGVVHSEDHATFDRAYVAGLSSAELIAAVWEMACEQWYRDHPHGPAPRLDRSAHGVRRREG